MLDNQKPKQYDAVLGGQSPVLEGAAVLGGLEGVRLRLSNPDQKVRIAALSQALNYGEQGLDLIIESLKDEFWDVQDAAYFILSARTEPRIKQLLQQPHRLGFKLEPIQVVTVNSYGEIIQRQQRLARYFTEDLGNGVTLEMAAIPGGTFIMGAPETEEGSSPYEYPQHEVTIQPFFMGKYPITRAQWRAVTALPPVSPVRWYLRSDIPGLSEEVNDAKHPAGFFDGIRVGISGNEALEFCARLSRKTGRDYRLPSESEWEYACRAGTTTPFHFGETLIPELANYGNASKGKRSRHTTPVGIFPPNGFGLYDMHGNVTEWCADTYHKNYKKAPKDGSVWVYDHVPRVRMLRGGCYFSCPQNCRSANRKWQSVMFPSEFNGFRVVCSAVEKIE